MEEHFFYNKIVVISGMFKYHTNDELKAIFMSFGSGVYSQVTRQTDYLICGVNPDFTDTELAMSYSIPILYEDDLIVWI